MGNSCLSKVLPDKGVRLENDNIVQYVKPTVNFQGAFDHTSIVQTYQYVTSPSCVFPQHCIHLETNFQ